MERKIRRGPSPIPEIGLNRKKYLFPTSFKPKTRRLPSHRLTAVDPPFPPPSTEVRDITIG